MNQSEQNEITALVGEMWPRWMFNRDEGGSRRTNGENARQLQRLLGRYSLRDAARALRDYYDAAGGTTYKPDLKSILSHLSNIGPGPEVADWSAQDETSLGLLLDFYTSHKVSPPPIGSIFRNDFGGRFPSEADRMRAQEELRARGAKTPEEIRRVTQGVYDAQP